MNITYYEGDTVQAIATEKLADYLAMEQGTLWIDITAPDDDDVAILRDVCGFHPLAIEDTRNQEQRPKAEEYSDHLFIIVNSVHLEAQGDDRFRELDVFVGRNYVVSVHAVAEPLLDRVRARLQPGRVSVAMSSAHILYTLLDEVVDQYLPLLERIEDELDALAGKVFTAPGRHILSRLFKLQQTLSDIGRVLGPKRDVLNVLMNHQLMFIDTNHRYYLRDVSDHLLRATDMLRTLRESVTSLLNLYLSAVSFRLNRDVNRLTLLAVIVGIMTVISGFYGMNFEKTWPPFSAWWSVPLVMVMMLAAVMYTLYSFRQHR